jgi:hypothetical protein
LKLEEEGGEAIVILSHLIPEPTQEEIITFAKSIGEQKPQ